METETINGKVKIYQHKKPVKMSANDMVLSETHKQGLLYGRKVTRKELFENGEKVGEHVPDYGKNMPPTYVEYKKEIYLIDKGYISFKCKTVEQLRKYKFIEFDKNNWAWRHKIVDQFSGTTIVLN